MGCSSGCYGVATVFALAALVFTGVPLVLAENSGKGYDVCVVGAGGSGAFTAVKLKQKGLKVLVLETSDYVGGHCTSESMPNGGWIDPGVGFYLNEPIATDTFTEWDVNTVPSSVRSTDPSVTRGVYLSAFSAWFATPPPSAADAARLQAAVIAWIRYWTTIWAPYVDTPNEAMPDFDELPASVVEQLVAPFGLVLQAAKAWTHDTLGVDLDPALPILTQLVTQGPGPPAAIPGIIGLRTLSPLVMRMILGQGLLISGGCTQLYSKFHQYLGGDVKLQAKYKLMRTGSGQTSGGPDANGVAATVNGTYVAEDGSTQKLRGSCKRVVISAIPSLANLGQIYAGGKQDLDPAENDVFSQITHNTFSWAKVRLGTSSGKLTAFTPDPPPLPAMVSFNIQQLPNGAGPNAVGLGVAYCVSLAPGDTADAVKARVHSTLQAWASAPGGPTFTVPSRVEDLLWSERPLALHQHTPRPSRSANLPRFYKALYRLQGYRGIYYTGALFSFNSQSSVWKYSQWLVNTHFAE